MKWISYVKYLFNLIKSLPLNRTEIIKFSTKLKDAFLNPNQSAIEFVTAILKKQNFIIQRVSAIVLLILAMLLGADIGINYERKNTNPALFEPKELTAPLERPEEKSQDAPVLEPQQDSSLDHPMEETKEFNKIIIAGEEPIPKENKQNFKRPPLPKRAVGEKPKIKLFKYEEIFQGPFHLGTSGPNGY